MTRLRAGRKLDALVATALGDHVHDWERSLRGSGQWRCKGCGALWYTGKAMAWTAYLKKCGTGIPAEDRDAGWKALCRRIVPGKGASTFNEAEWQAVIEAVEAPE